MADPTSAPSSQAEAVDPDLIERFRVAVRALVGIRQPPVQAGQKFPVYAEDVETMVDVLHALESMAAPTVPCPVCGGEAVHAHDLLRRTVIRPAPESPAQARAIDGSGMSHAAWLAAMAGEEPEAPEGEAVGGGT